MVLCRAAGDDILAAFWMPGMLIWRLQLRTVSILDCIGPDYICVELYPDLYYNSWIRRLAGGATDWTGEAG